MCRPAAKASVFERLQKKPGPISPRQGKKTRQANGLDGAIQTRLRMDAVPSKTGPSNGGLAEDYSSPDVEEDTALAKTASGLSGVSCANWTYFILDLSRKNTILWLALEVTTKGMHRSCQNLLGKLARSPRNLSKFVPLSSACGSWRNVKSSSDPS